MVQEWRRHPRRNQELIRRSLEEVGPFRSIALDGDGIVRAGNGVLEQAQALGLKVRVVEAKADGSCRDVADLAGVAFDNHLRAVGASPRNDTLQRS